MPQQSFMEALFGKKRRVVKRKRKVVKRKTTKRKVVRKKLPKSLKTQAKKHGVRVTLKRGDRRVEKSEKMLRKQVRMAMKRKEMKKREMMKKKSKKVVKRKAPKRRVKRKTRKAPKRRVKRRTAKFGKGAGFPPLSRVMSPYPYSVSASPPWI